MIFILLGSASTYETGDLLDIRVKSVSNLHNPLKVDYNNVPSCAKKVHPQEFTNLGNFLLGLRSQNSPYEFQFNLNRSCSKTCDLTINATGQENLKFLISEKYKIYYSVDDIPVTFMGVLNPKLNESFWQDLEFYAQNDGVPFGLLTKNNSIIFFNHIKFLVLVAKYQIQEILMVQAFVDSRPRCNSSDFPQLGKDPIQMTHEVQYELVSSLPAQDREAIYYKRRNQIILVFVLNILGLILIVSLIMRSVHIDVSAFENIFLCASANDLREDTSWKRLQREVFRPPGNPFLLSQLVGIGCQIITSFILSLLLMLLSHLGNDIVLEAGNNLYKFMICLVAASPVGGFVASKLYKMWGPEYWLSHAISTALILPLSVVGLVLIIFLLRLIENSQIVLIMLLIQYVLFWMIIPSVLSLVGSFLALKSPTLKNPCGVSLVQQQHPTKKNSQVIFLVVSSLIPFAVILAELIYMLNAFWETGLYLNYGLLLATAFLLFVTSGEIAIIAVYNRLNNLDPKWWWISFKLPALSSAYVSCFAVLYLLSLGELGVVSWLVCLTWVGVLSGAYMLFCGSAGFICSYLFVRKIYSLIRSE